MDESEGEGILGKIAGILSSVEDEAYGFWRFHSAAGMFFGLTNNVAEARERFETALALDRSMTEAYPGYLGHLVACGKPTEAVHLAQRYLGANVDNIGAYATCAMTMALAGKIPEAEEIVNRALKLDRAHPSIRILASIFKLAEAPALESEDFSQLQTILDDVSYELLKRELLERGGLIPDPES